jgi:adenylate cyclase
MESACPPHTMRPLGSARQMKALLSRRRFEALALAVCGLCVLLHLWSDGQPSIGLIAGKASTSAVSALGRGIHLLEGRATDLKFRLRGPHTPHPDVRVVEIDEKSAQKYGLWPWPRTLIATAIKNLIEADAAVVGLDIAFTDEAADDGKIYRALLTQFDQAQGADVAALAGFRAELVARSSESADATLEAAFRQAKGRVVQGVISYSDADLASIGPEKVSEHNALLAPHLLQAEGNLPGSTFSIDKLQGWPSHSAQTPLRRFATVGSHLGHFSYVPDVDGTIRRSAILIKLTGAKGLLTSLPLQTAAVFLDARLIPTQEGGFLTGVRLEPKNGTPYLAPYQGNEPFMLINHVGSPDVFPRLSIGDVIDGTFDRTQVTGKAILIGVTLVGATGDQRVTPFSEFTPGVFAHASVVSNLLNKDFLSRPSWLVLAEAFAMLVLGFALSQLIPRLKSFGFKALVIVGVAGAWLVIDQGLFSLGTQVATVMPVSSILATSFGLIFLGYLSVDREKVQLRSTFTKYLGADVMEEALRHPDKLSAGEKREMTVLFSDIRGFTTLSERMLPEKLAAFMKDYLSPMTQIVFDEKGTLDKYIGDAVMAFWNAPLDQNDHAVRAVRCAWAMLIKLEELKAKWRADNFP